MYFGLGDRATSNTQSLSISFPREIYHSICFYLYTQFLWVFTLIFYLFLHLTFVYEFLLWNFKCIPFLELSCFISFLLLTAKGSVASPFKQEIIPHRNYVQVSIFIQYVPSLNQEEWQSKALLFNSRAAGKTATVAWNTNLGASLIIHQTFLTWPDSLPVIW